MSIGFVTKDGAERFCEALNADAEFRLAAQAMSKVVLLAVGKERCFVRIRAGEDCEVKLVSAGAFDMTGSDAAIAGSKEAWGKLLSADPAPGYIDVLTALASGELQVGGDISVQHIYRHAIARMIKVLREVQSGSKPPFVRRPAPPPGTIEPIVGRYVWTELAGTSYRVYFEEGGNPDGIPLICQHTAGADGRQWRFLMNDPVVAAQYRIIACDLPYHGKSLPPDGIEWWKQRYVLDASLGQDFPVAFARALGLDRPVYLGVSIGGMIASDLPWKHPGVFRAVIACEAGEFMPGWDIQIPALTDPSCRAMTTDMSHCQAPGVPVQNIHENTWLNDSSAFGVVGGDLHYYAYVHDLRDKYALFDTAKTAVYIMNGEFDYATPPALAEQIAGRIPGAKAIALNGLGHFPHSEDYELFKTYLHPVLDEIALL